ncbi:MAG: tetratricopeptide repeat protein [Bacteroidia bacterium]|nr:tetratricopeptide repeat protein [Bacteroidia bacterium]
MKSKRPRPAQTTGKTDGRNLPSKALLYRSGTVFVLLVLLRIFAAYQPDARLWGISYLAYLPDWAMYTVSAFGVLLALGIAYPMFRLKAAWMEKWSGRTVVLVATLGCAALFWGFRMDTYFLGDGAVYLAEHFRLVRGMDVSDTVLYSLLSAPLTGYLLAGLSTLLWSASEGSGLLGNPQAAWWLSGAVAGAVYVFVVFSGMRRFSNDGAVRVAGLAVLLLAPGALFFFGYVEYYTLLLTAGTAYFFSTDRAVRGEVPVWIPAVLLGFCVAFHFMSLLLLPGFLLLLHARGLKEDDGSATMRMLRIGTAAALLLGGLWYFASGTAFEGSRVILSLSPFGEEGAMQHYTLLHPAHLLDVVNILLLVGGPLLMVLPFLWTRKIGTEAAIALAHVLFLGFLLFFGYTGFGMARDWDVNALFGVALGMYVLTLLRSQSDAARRSWLSYVLAGAMLAGTLPWLAVNITTEASVARFRDVIALDDELIPGDFALNGYEHLRKYYQSVGNSVGVAWAIQKKTEMVGYPDDFRKYVLAAVTTMRGAERELAFTSALGGILERLRRMKDGGVEKLYEGSMRSFEEVYTETLMQAEYLGLAGALQPSLARTYLDSLRALETAGVGVVLAEGLMREARGIPPESIAQFASAAAAIESSGTLAAYAGRVLLANGRYEEAVVVLRRAIEFDNQFTLPSLYLAQALLRLDTPDPAAAAEQLRRFLASPEGHRVGDPAAQRQLIDTAERMLLQLQTQ